MSTATAATHTLHAQAQEYMTKVTDLSNAADDDVTEEMQKRGHDDTLEKLQGDLDEVEAQIAMKPSVSAHVLKSYQERAVVVRIFGVADFVVALMRCLRSRILSEKRLRRAQSSLASLLSSLRHRYIYQYPWTIQLER